MIHALRVNQTTLLANLLARSEVVKIYPNRGRARDLCKVKLPDELGTAEADDRAIVGLESPRKGVLMV